MGGGTGVAFVTADQQADNVDAAYWAAKAVPYVPVVTWFRLAGQPRGQHLLRALHRDLGCQTRPCPLSGPVRAGQAHLRPQSLWYAMRPQSQV